MKYSRFVLQNGESAMLALRTLYKEHGYSQYKMSKFEEYDLYVRNKSFLVDKNVLTFTDTNGRLMALKPDVTLSIVKNYNGNNNDTQKVYYSENVYRVSNTSGEFKEIMQTGLECIGNIDLYSTCEVIMLACGSLEAINGKYILSLSHMGILTGLLDELDISGEKKEYILRCISEKNIHGARDVCKGLCEDTALLDRLESLISLYGPIDKVLGALDGICVNEKMRQSKNELEQISKVICSCGLGEHVHLDFSIINDMNYYNGVIFQGFIDGIPTGVLSGGRYDNLLYKMGKEAGAIGFAVYVNLLERLNLDGEDNFDTDILLIYDENTAVEEIFSAADSLRNEGKTVLVKNKDNGDIRYRELVKITGGGVSSIE